MAEPTYRIALVSRLPAKPHLDVLFRTTRGFGVHITDDDVQALKNQNIAVVQLYATPEDYAGAVLDLNKQNALAAVQTVQDVAIAALESTDRDQFSVA